MNVVPARERRLAIFAPGGHDADPTRLERARARFAARGYRVDLRFDPAERHERFAGTDAARLAWIARLCDEPGGIAIALRGGYGATRLLPSIDWAAMAAAVARGTRFVGHSDFTAIQLGLLATTGAATFAGPMASFGFGRDDVDPDTDAWFWRAMEAGVVDVAFDTPHDGSLDVRGMLWGGNLAMLASTIGTPWLPAIDGGILFVEDVNEPPYRVERMLLQLVQAGIVDRQRAVLVGDVTGFRATDDGYDVARALARVRETTDVPIVAGLPFGHGPRVATLAVGVEARLTIDAGRARLSQRA